MISFAISDQNQPTVDLLPWADPYIAQLFRDADLLDEPSPVVHPRRGKTVAGREAGAMIETVLSSDEWQLNPMSRQRLNRSRRVEPERPMAHC